MNSVNEAAGTLLVLCKNAERLHEAAFELVGREEVRLCRHCPL